MLNLALLINQALQASPDTKNEGLFNAYYKLILLGLEIT